MWQMKGLYIQSPQNITTGLRQEIRENKLVLGECCISDESPRWKCIDCSMAIYKLKIDFKDSVN